MFQEPDPALLKILQGRQPHDMTRIVCRVRDEGQPYGTGQGVAFTADKLEWDDPAHETAIDKLANWLAVIME